MSNEESLWDNRRKKGEMGMKERIKKYDAITQYLKNNGATHVTLTFTQIDDLLCPTYGLPKSASQSTD